MKKALAGLFFMGALLMSLAAKADIKVIVDKECQFLKSDVGISVQLEGGSFDDQIMLGNTKNYPVEPNKSYKINVGLVFDDIIYQGTGIKTFTLFDGQTLSCHLNSNPCVDVGTFGIDNMPTLTFRCDVYFF